ncbi:unnamed protein product [Rotaria sordida]|uniref:N-acetyltransferase domain-containing protein n=1 Tax=Rotaria sordida TaxID=392033 RepID=A0A813Q575_9BILA|nr:unnamed protein product [Rotaria sordida]CAF0754413.1 unnamed protein product [Rotaria sordida]CAF0762262.1 unnamed protein product [Rotaria sordida]CAF0774221.1 unnamed protein product [Rotaria sordida]CAF3496309.1 unnamed protein product [Rotaria sordida]
MFLSICFALLLLIVIVPCKSDYSVYYCSNGRPAFSIFNVSTFTFSAQCSIPGRSCYGKKGKCSKEYLCCPRTLKMSSKLQLYDRATNIKFIRIGIDYKNAHRLYELNLLSNNSIMYDSYQRWFFFEKTLRDLFEMPNARFWYAIINCMQNNGIAYVFVPLNATSITANISAIIILTRQKNSFDNLYICHMATRKEYRRQGLGTHLLQQSIYRALNEQQNGIKYISLHVNTLNTIALEFYEKCGWRCYEYLPKYLDPEPHHTTNHAYALKLNLDNVKNVTGLCRDPDAIDIKQSDNEKSIENCNRIPTQLEK